jgi:capsular polysaccharide biosynthesis protein
VEIKIVDNVLVSKYPVKPNILINGLIGLLTGFVISISYVLLQKEKKQKKEEKTVKEVMEKPAQSAYEQTAPEVERYEKYPEEELEVMPKEK